MNKDKEPLDFFITSDTWFGRPQILDIANRTSFSSIEKMNEVFIKNWNSLVKPDDIVFHLGNFAWDPITARKVFKKLNGEISFLIGHSDDALLEVESEFSNINIINGQIVELPDHDSVLCHYPLEVWNGKFSGTLHFHGHTTYSHKTDLSVSNRINVCPDFWDYYPVKYSTIKYIINEKQKNL